MHAQLPLAWADLSLQLDRLLTLPPLERDRQLDEMAANDAALSARLRELLVQRDAASRDGFLSGAAAPQWLPVQLHAGAVLGAWTLQEPIGEGGMGSVWRARRSDGRFEGEAAIKVLKSGAIDAAVRERFRREGAILARLKHPGIAQLFDAGVTEQGAPYLVLELVYGERIDRWCDARRLPLAARIELLLQVLDAVAAAHAQLVIHRDLKPSNILVDEQARVRLLDFGIAHLLPGNDGAQTALTREGAFALTPQYAAPEQATDAALSTATDVYALGVVLHELLTGVHPSGLSGASALAYLRAASEGAEVRASVRALQSSNGVASAAQRAQARDCTPQALARQLRGDLDNILARALAPLAADRYATVPALADDLRRHLRHEPVSARPDAFGYRAAKFLRRHRFGSAAAGLLALAVLAGTAGTAWQAIEAARQRDLALAQAERARAASDFVDLMLYSTWGAEERISRAEFLARSEALALRQMPEAREAASVVLSSLGFYHASLADQTKAEDLLRRAVAALPAQADASWRAQVECAHASAQGQLGRADEARARLQHWVARADIEAAAAVQCEMYLAQLAQTQQDAAAALRHAEQAERRLAGAPRVPPLLRASLHGDLGFGLALNGRMAEADRHYETALRMHREIGHGESPAVLAILNNASVARWIAGDVRGADQLNEELARIAGARGAAGEAPLYSLINRAVGLVALGRPAEAEPLARRGLEVAELTQAHGLWHQRALLALANAANDRGEPLEAQHWLDRARARVPTTEPGNDLHGMAITQSRVFQLRRQLRQALDALEPVFAAHTKPGRPSSTHAAALRRRGELRLEAGDAAGALADAELAADIGRQLLGGRPHALRIGQAWLLAARAHAALGQAAAARDAAVTAREHLAAMLHEGHADLLLAQGLTGQ